jgi:hypothetical protein
MHQDKSARLLSLMTRVLKNMYTPARLEELIEELNPRDQAMLFMHYVRPPQPEKPKDELERLDDESLEKLANKVTEQARRAYR